MEIFRACLCQGKRQITAAAELAVHFQGCFREEDVAPASCELCCHFAKVAGTDDILEPDIVYACIQGRLALDFILDEEYAALCHDLALDNARYNRVAREMSPAEEFVFPDSVFGMGHTLFVDLNFVDKQHGFPVRQVFFEFFSVHIFKINNMV